LKIKVENNWIDVLSSRVVRCVNFLGCECIFFVGLCWMTSVVCITHLKVAKILKTIVNGNKISRKWENNFRFSVSGQVTWVKMGLCVSVTYTSVYVFWKKKMCELNVWCVENWTLCFYGCPFFAKSERYVNYVYSVFIFFWLYRTFY